MSQFEFLLPTQSGNFERVRNSTPVQCTESVFVSVDYREFCSVGGGNYPFSNTCLPLSVRYQAPSLFRTEGMRWKSQPLYSGKADPFMSHTDQIGGMPTDEANALR